jgi:nucleotide-binding universal stress UspA family protein
LLISSRQSSGPLLNSVIVCWKETAEAARAIGAAMALLAKAERVVLAGAEEDDPWLADGLADLSRQMAWHGVNVRVEFIPSGGGTSSEMLIATARAHGANLLVMGGYGHSHMREIIFGGFTQSVLQSADITALLMH